MTLKPEYYVIRLGRQIDPNKDNIVPGQLPVAQIARPREVGLRLNDRFRVEPIPEIPAPINGYGNEILRSELRDPVINFTTVECAAEYAQEMAEKNPKTLYAVMGILKVYESAKSPVIEKRFNENGELVIAGGI